MRRVLVGAVVAWLLAAGTRVESAGCAEPSTDTQTKDAISDFEDDEPAPADDALESPTQEEELPDSGWQLGSTIWNLGGYVSLGAIYEYEPHHSSSGTPYGGLTLLREKGFLQLDGALPANWAVRASGYGFYDLAYLIHHERDYTDQVLNEYETGGEIQELWASGSPLDGLDVKLGRQMITWGRSNTVRVVDVINPLDNRQPGLLDIEDIKRSLTMSRLDYYVGPWTFESLLIPEVRYDLNPHFGSDWFPTIERSDVLKALAIPGCSPPPSDACPSRVIDLLINDASEGFLVARERPSRFGKHLDFGLASTGSFPGWDISFYASRFIDRGGHVALDPDVLLVDIRPEFEESAGLPPGTCQAPPPELETVCERARVAPARVPKPVVRSEDLLMLGLGGNFIRGSWLLKGEFAWFHGLRYDYLNGSTVDVENYLAGASEDAFTVDVRSRTTSRIDAMLGVEYYGFADTTLTFEAVERHLIDYTHKLLLFPNYLRQDSVEYVLRLDHSFLRNRLGFSAVGLLRGWKAQDGIAVRLALDYELMEAVNVGGGILMVFGGNVPPTHSLGKNDQLFLRFRYSF